MTTCYEKTSPINRLPKELRDLICDHIASALHAALHHSIIPENDPLVFTWIMSAVVTYRPPDCQIIQKHLRALSLVSKAWSHSAQRALFAVIPISSAWCLLKLLRSLLLYPKNRPYIRCLLPKFSYECDLLYMGSLIADEVPGIITLTLFIDTLADILNTPILEELPYAGLLRMCLTKHRNRPRLLASSIVYPYFVYRFREVLNLALCSVIHLSPRLHALHLRTERGEERYFDVPFVYGEEMAYSRRFREGSHPRLTTLSLNRDAFPRPGYIRDDEGLDFDCWMACTPTIRYITLLGNSGSPGFTHANLSLNLSEV